MFQNINTRKQGDIGVAFAIEYFLKEGYTVSIPFGENQDYDLIVDNGAKLLKVQVKTSRMKSHGSYVVSLCTKGGNHSTKYKTTFFTERDVDLLFVLTEDGKKYLIPKREIKNVRRSISLGRKYSEYEIREEEGGKNSK